MSEREMEAKLLELDRLLNDPEVQMDPHRVWSLLQEIAGSAKAAAVPRPA
ncbi:MAG TPA: peptide chain release factor 1 [Roseomonas sp.]|nr:peptide chain release factor 1 [Roseomonas sp.]